MLKAKFQCVGAVLLTYKGRWIAANWKKLQKAVHCLKISRYWFYCICVLYYVLLGCSLWYFEYTEMYFMYFCLEFTALTPFGALSVCFMWDMLNEYTLKSVISYYHCYILLGCSIYKHFQINVSKIFPDKYYNGFK